MGRYGADTAPYRPIAVTGELLSRSVHRPVGRRCRRVRCRGTVGHMNTMRLRSPGDVVAVLPYQLGYHPDDSLVVVALRDRAVVLVERVDLPAAADADEATQ